MSALIIFLPFCSRNAKAPGWLIPGKKSKGCMTYFVAQLSLPQERLHSIRCPRSGSFYWLSCKVWMCACVRVCARVAHAHLSFSLSLSSFSLSSSRSLYSHTSQGAPMLALEFRYMNRMSTISVWGHSEGFMGRVLLGKRSHLHLLQFGSGSIHVCSSSFFFLTAMHVGGEVGWHFIYFKLSFFFP